VAPGLPLYTGVKKEFIHRAGFNPAVRLASSSVLLLLTISVLSQADLASAQSQDAAATQAQDAAAAQAIAAFNDRVNQYIKLRKKAEGLPSKLSKKSQPEQIDANLAALQASISSARVGAKPGDIFAPDIAKVIRRAIRQEFRGERLRKLRETILLRLPVLPKELQYRFVGGYLLLLDKEARMIVDFMAGAVPRTTTSKR
jgi:type II secretory pathway component PulJ